MTPAVTRAALRLSRRPGTFMLNLCEKKIEWPYSASFEWEGHVFVVHRSYLLSDYPWKTSHKESGFGVSPKCNAKSVQGSARLAMKVLEENGKRRLLNAIRKAKKKYPA